MTDNGDVMINCLRNEILKEIHGFEFEIRMDISRTSLEDSKNVFYIQTIEDRSVGIFGNSISPNFSDMVELCNWWQKNKGRIKAIKEISEELNKGMVFYGVINEIIEKYELKKRDIKEICDLFVFDNKLRSFLYHGGILKR